MTTKEIRQELIKRAVEGWRDSEYVRDGSFSLSQAKFGIEEAIRQADDEGQFEMLKAYWLGLTQRGRKALISRVWQTLMKPELTQEN